MEVDSDQLAARFEKTIKAHGGDRMTQATIYNLVVWLVADVAAESDMQGLPLSFRPFRVRTTK